MIYCLRGDIMEYVIIIVVSLIFILVVAGLIYLLYFSIKYPSRKPTYSEKQAMQHITSDGQIYCSKCHSVQISANKKGLSLATGLIGSQKVYITCLRCGHRWKAGH